MLVTPDEHALIESVWIALNASDADIASHPQHTLAGRLDLCSSQLLRLAVEARLWGAKGLKPTSGVPKRLRELRARRFGDDIRVIHFDVHQCDDKTLWLRYVTDAELLLHPPVHLPDGGGVSIAAFERHP